MAVISTGEIDKVKPEVLWMEITTMPTETEIIVKDDM